MRKAVSYCRVSTAGQQVSGLGLDSQRKAIQTYLSSSDWELLAEFVETESGGNDDRPVLQEALRLCVLTGATLVVSKLDRLARSVNFLSGLQKAGTPFIAVDFPEANAMMLGILAVLAEYERKLIAERTAAALKSAKERGPTYCIRRGRMTYPLGATGAANLTKNPETAAKGRQLGSAALVNKADEFARRMRPTLEIYMNSGVNTPTQIATRLNAANILTARKKRGSWTAQGVKNILTRLNLT